MFDWCLSVLSKCVCIDVEDECIESKNNDNRYAEDKILVHTMPYYELDCINESNQQINIEIDGNAY